MVNSNALTSFFGGGSSTTLLFFFILLVLIYGGKGFAFGEEVGTESFFGFGSNWIIWLLLILCLCGGSTWK
jgi:hypothetical protein